jgi:DNA-binding NarL/FixJ family response regulator
MSGPSAASKIRVVIVDDQTLMRQGLRGLLSLAPDIEVAGEAATADDAVRAIGSLRPDLVLLDVRLPGRSGLELLRELAAAGNLPPTILLTTFDDDTAFAEGVRAGARGFLLKDVSMEQLTEAIRTVVAGGTAFRPALTDSVSKRLQQVRHDFDSLDRPDPPTKRELEVLRLMAAGCSNREIAEALGTAEGTVKNHISTILSKLGVRDRTRAVLKALEGGWI